jgi:hypothetical protein
MLLALWIAFLSCSSPVAQFGPGPPAGQGAPSGPWNHDVLLYRVTSAGKSEKMVTFERAGVSTLARLKDGRIIIAYQHFPENDTKNFDKVAVRFSSDEGKKWTTPQPIVVAGLPAGMMRPFDPTLVPLPDGRVRLYFTGNYGGTFQNSKPAIHSAISTNGVDYTYENGIRFSVSDQSVIDCAVVLHRGVFHLYAPHAGPANGQGFHATSTNGLEFKRTTDVRLEGRRRWLGNAQSDGSVITFFGTDDSTPDRTGQPRSGIWFATSTDGTSWGSVSSLFLNGADPAAIKTRDGDWLISATSTPVRNVSPPKR